MTTTTHYSEEDEARDKVPSPTFGVPPSRANSPGSPISQRGAYFSDAERTTSRPGIQRTVTTESRLSRVASKLPNPEREVAEGPAPKPPAPPHLKKYSYHCEFLGLYYLSGDGDENREADRENGEGGGREGEEVRVPHLLHTAH